MRRVHSSVKGHQWRYLWQQNVRDGNRSAHIPDPRRRLDELGVKLGLTGLDDWYKLSKDELVGHLGVDILSKYDNSPWKLFKTVYPEHLWVVERFLDVSDGKRVERKQLFMDWLGKKLGFNSMDDWYNVTGKDIRKYGGKHLLHKYGNSAPKLVMATYHEYPWKESNFRSTRNAIDRPVSPLHRLDESVLADRKKSLKFVEWMGEELHVGSLDDWYRVSLQQIHRVIPPSAMKFPLEMALQAAYPERVWDVAKLQFKSGTMKASQRLLAAFLRDLFPTSDLWENYLHKDLARGGCWKGRGVGYLSSK